MNRCSWTNNKNISSGRILPQSIAITVTDFLHPWYRQFGGSQKLDLILPGFQEYLYPFVIARLDLLYPFFFNLELDHTTIHNLGTKMIQNSGRSRGGAQGARPPLFLDHSEVQRAEKCFLETFPPHTPYLKVGIRHCKDNNCFPFHKDKEAFCNSSIIMLWYFNMPLRSGFSIRAGSWQNSPAISC